MVRLPAPRWQPQENGDGMKRVIRDVRAHELDAVLAMNNAAGAGILPIDRERLEHHWHHATYFRVAEVDGQLTGFLIALAPDADYDSPNFLWFRDRYPDFIYIDRIVVAHLRTCRAASTAEGRPEWSRSPRHQASRRRAPPGRRAVLLAWQFLP